MKELNYLNLLTAVREAITYPEMKVAIFTGRSKRVGEISKELFEVIDAIEEFKECTGYKCSGACTKNIVGFKNGSDIEITTIHHGSLQKPYHKILYDDNIGALVLHDILPRLESLPYDKTILKWRQ